MLPDFLGQIQSDFEVIASGEFAEEVTITDGTETVTLRCLFACPSTSFDPDTQSFVSRPEYSITVAETATAFNLRRPGLSVTVRGDRYLTRKSDWQGDGLGELLIYLDKA